MKHPELKFRHRLINAMSGHWQYTWHEDRGISPGVPDMHYVMRAHHRVGWLELKATERMLSKSSYVSVEPSQHQYIRKWGHLMPIHFLVDAGGEVFMIPSMRHVELSGCRSNIDLKSIAFVWFDRDETSAQLPLFLSSVTKID